MRSLHACLAIIGVAAFFIGAEPATPAPDYSSPRALQISYQNLIIAGDLDALEKCTVPPANDDERLRLRTLNWRTTLFYAINQRLNPPESRYATWAQMPQRAIADAQSATETIDGDTAQLTSPGRQPIDFRKTNGLWRLAPTFVSLEPAQKAVLQTQRAFAERFLVDLRAGKITSLAEVDKRFARLTSQEQSLRRVQPIYTPENPDPAGLRIAAVAVPADKSPDNLFHVDLVLTNAGPTPLRILLGAQRPDGQIRFARHSYLEAVDAQGEPTNIPIISGEAYSGSAPEPWILTLIPGAQYTLRPQMPFGAPLPPRPRPEPPVRGSRAASRPAASLTPYYLPPGTYTFTATLFSNQVHEKRQPGDLYRADLQPHQVYFSALTIWTGTVVSAPGKIEVPAP